MEIRNIEPADMQFETINALEIEDLLTSETLKEVVLCAMLEL